MYSSVLELDEGSYAEIHCRVDLAMPDRTGVDSRHACFARIWRSDPHRWGHLGLQGWQLAEAVLGFTMLNAGDQMCKGILVSGGAA